MFARILLLFASVFGLSACSTLPQELNATTAQVLTSYDELAQAKGQTRVDVRLGGVIAKVDNLKDQTRLEIVNLAIDAFGKPDLSQEPVGRFAVYFDGYLEPVAFSQGRLITIIGKGAGEEKGYIGEHPYVFPVIKGDNYRLWKIEEHVRIYDTSLYSAPCHSIHCRKWRSDFYQDGTVIRQVK